MEDFLKNKINEMIRVNHAGEFGAQKIYNAQIKYSNDKKLKEELKKIAEEELVHLNYFEEEMVSSRARPTIMRPIWHLGGTFRWSYLTNGRKISACLYGSRGRGDCRTLS